VGSTSQQFITPNYGTQGLCDQLQEVLYSARPNLNAKEAQLELIIEFQDIFKI
jgi:hypothetical protein